MMSVKTSLNDSIEIECPVCNTNLVLDDLEVSVTVDGHDTERPKKEGVDWFKCRKCGGTINIVVRLNIEVSERRSK